MPDQQPVDWTKYLGGAAAAIVSATTAVRLFFRARNGGQSDRITQLELGRREDRRVMADLRRQMEETQITLQSTERRVRQVEVNQYDLDREVRDNLQRMIEQIDRRLSHSDEQGRAKTV